MQFQFGYDSDDLRPSSLFQCMIEIVVLTRSRIWYLECGMFTLLRLWKAVWIVLPFGTYVFPVATLISPFTDISMSRDSSVILLFGG